MINTAKKNNKDLPKEEIPDTKSSKEAKAAKAFMVVVDSLGLFYYHKNIRQE